MGRLFDQLEAHPDAAVSGFIELGLHHEQQHQELLCMDIKANFSVNPLKPAYRHDWQHPLYWARDGQGGWRASCPG